MPEALLASGMTIGGISRMSRTADRSFARHGGALDGETLAFLASAFQRALADEFRRKFAEKLSRIEVCLSQVECAASGAGAGDALAGKVQAARASVAELLASLERVG